MSAIVCYKGKENAKDVVLKGLTKLEYIGHDSSGLATIEDDRLVSVKRSGRLSNLKLALNSYDLKGKVGIGHLRWATQGVQNDLNAHPHLSNDKNIAIVHNGLIENFEELKKDLIREGYSFTSDTDSEVIAVLIEKYYHGDLLEAVRMARKDLKGSYALGVIAASEPDRLVCLKKHSPLILGMADHGYVVTTDSTGLIDETKKMIFLSNGDLVDIRKDSFQVYDEKNMKVNRNPKQVSYSLEDAPRDGFKDFMLKEIYDQPQAVKDCLRNKVINKKISLGSSSFTRFELRHYNKIYIVGAGSAYRAANIGRFAMEKYAKIPTRTEQASEFRYKNNLIDGKTLVILVSQSGETADTLASLRKARSYGATTLAITNVVASSIDREANKSIYCLAGPELAVASTKAYTTQIVTLLILALDFGLKFRKIEEKEAEQVLKEIEKLPEKIQEILDDTKTIQDFAQELKDHTSLFYMGRGIDLETAKEGALKLKEVSYIHAEAVPAGEIKHGSLALIEKDSPVIAVVSQKKLVDQTLTNVRGVIDRGAKVFSIVSDGGEELEKISYKSYRVPHSLDILYPVLNVVVEQLLAYYTSIAKGIDVDKPRNLFKSISTD